MRERDTAWRAWEDVCAETGAGRVIRSRVQSECAQDADELPQVERNER
jgi:hypothetical protein